MTKPYSKVAFSSISEEAGGALVADNLVSTELFDELADLADFNIWRFGSRPDGSAGAHAFWFCNFAEDTRNNRGDFLNELSERRLFKPIYALWLRLAETIAREHTLIRTYAMSHTYGVGGGVHRDNETDPSLFTYVYYAHRRWEPGWGGETVFFDSGGRDVVQAVHPVPGRTIFFRGDIEHCARPLSRECPALRVVYVFKTRLA